MVVTGIVLLDNLHATPGPTRLLEWINLSLGILVVLLATLDGFRPIMAVHGVFSLCWLGIAPVVQIELRQSAWQDWSTVGDFAQVNQALLLGCAMSVALLVGVFLGDRRSERSNAKRARDASGTHLSLPVVGACAVALLLLTPIVVGMQGGLGSLFIDRNARAEVLAGASLDNSGDSGVGNGLAVLLPGSMAVALGHLTIRAWHQRSTSGGRGRVVLLASGLISLIGLVLFNNPLSNTRFIAAIGLGSIVVALAAPRRRVAGRFMGLLLMVTVLFIYPLGNIIGGRDSTMPGMAGALTGADFDGFQQVINTLLQVRLHGHGNGLHVASALFFFVPRSIWVAKEKPATFEVAQAAGYSFQNLSLPFHAELYMDFGVLGMVLLGVAYGYWMGYFDNAWLTRPRADAALLVPLAALAQLAVIRGPLGSLTPVYLTPLVLIGVALPLSRLFASNGTWVQKYRHRRAKL